MLANSETNTPDRFRNSLGIEMIRVPAGTFLMGNNLQTDPKEFGQYHLLTQGGYDEQPVHQVTISQPFYISETEITGKQYRHFRRDYQDLGPFPPYVTGVRWSDAAAFCAWLSKKEKRPYRLPTEAEWEYAARAGSSKLFSNGGQPLAPGQANAFGLKDMESEAPEWVRDWYGAYSSQPQTDPVGPADGWTRVVRGGGIMGPYQYTPSGPYFYRDANRASIAPEFHGRTPVGFRIVQAALPHTQPQAVQPHLWQQFVKNTNAAAKAGPNPDQPWFRQRDLLPIPPEDEELDAIKAAGIAPGVLGHNHSPGVAVMPNGDVFAVYFSSPQDSSEYIPHTSFVAVRRRFGSNQWDMPQVFYDFGDVNDQSALLWNDHGTVRFFGGGVGLDGVPFRMQATKDSGKTWTRPAFPLLRGPIGGFTPQPITSAFHGPDGRIYLATDAIGGHSVLWASDDGGRTWIDTQGRTDGRHTTFVVLKDGSILGMGGKNTNIDGFMPKSISKDGGKTWTFSKTPFPALGSNQRPFLMRLADGRLFFACDWQSRKGKQPTGITKHGAFVALSSDEGKTWHIKTIPGTLPHEAHAMPETRGGRKDYGGFGTLGYTVAAQGPNGLIHLITSMNHPAQEFVMNEAWILSDETQQTGRSKPGPRTLHTENYPGGAREAQWGSETEASGRYLLDGPETWYYPNGKKEYEATWQRGVKIGRETYWDRQGRKRWEWNRHPGALSTWTQYWSNGQIKHISHWRGDVCEGEATAYGPAGKMIGRYHFEDGQLQ